MKNRTHYQVLEVSENASLDAIRKAYKLKALKFHPDKNKDAGAEEEFKAIANAHEALSDADKRRKYDHELAQQRAHQNKPKVNHQAEAPKPAPQSRPAPTTRAHQTEMPKPAPRSRPAPTRSHTWTKPETTQKPATAKPTHFAQPTQHRMAKPTNINRSAPIFADVKSAAAKAKSAARPTAAKMDARLYVLMILLQMEAMRQVQLQIAMQLVIRDVLAAQLDHIYKAQHAVRHDKNDIDTRPAYTSPGIRA